jgi:hypothetical protein
MVTTADCEIAGVGCLIRMANGVAAPTESGGSRLVQMCGVLRTWEAATASSSNVPGTRGWLLRFRRRGIEGDVALVVAEQVKLHFGDTRTAQVEVVEGIAIRRELFSQ